MKPRTKFFFLILIFSIINLIIPANNISADKIYRVLVLPFNIHSEQDLSFLQKGIEDMLSSRLSIEGKVVLISQKETSKATKDLPKPITEDAALSLGTMLQADYVLVGSLTVFGNSISTDGRFIDVQNQKPVVIFNQFGKSHDDVIAHINLFAGQINEKVFGRKIYASQPPLPVKTEVNTRSHPEKIFSGDQHPESMIVGPPEAATERSFSFWKSRKFKTGIKGMAAGDVDGDGKIETVFIDNSTVFIYRHHNGKFGKVAEIAGSINDNFVGVDVADINHNKKAEIFVTNLSTNTKRLKSFVLEWNGAQFNKIEDKSNWYYRVLHVPARGGYILVGQQRALERLFSGKGVYELIWNNGQYEPADRQVLPKNINVFGFTYGNVFNDGREMIVAFTSDDYIRVLDKDGKEEWKSSDPFGGSATYLERPYEVDQAEPPSERLKEHVYLHQRIHIADSDKDGKNELIVVKNSTTRFSSRLRIFKGGHIESLSMDALGPSLKWKTRKISGHISDYAIADMDNDGHDELVFSVISKTASALGKANSFLVLQNITQ